MSNFLTLLEIVAITQPSIGDIRNLLSTVKERAFILQQDVIESERKSALEGLFFLFFGIIYTGYETPNEEKKLRKAFNIAIGLLKNSFPEISYLIEKVLNEKGLEYGQKILWNFITSEFNRDSQNNIHPSKGNKQGKEFLEGKFLDIDSILCEGFSIINIGEYFIENEFQYLQEQIKNTKNPYMVALYGYGLFLNGKEEEGINYLEQSRKMGNNLALFYLGMVGILNSKCIPDDIIKELENRMYGKIFLDRLNFEFQEQSGNSGLGRLSKLLTFYE